MIRLLALTLILAVQSSPALADPLSPRTRQEMGLQGPVGRFTEVNALWRTETAYLFSREGRLTASLEISIDVENPEAESRIHWFYDDWGRPVDHRRCGLDHSDPSHDYCDVSRYEYDGSTVKIWGWALEGRWANRGKRSDTLAHGRLIAAGDLDEHGYPAFLEARAEADFRADELQDTFNCSRVEYVRDARGRLVSLTRLKIVDGDDGRVSARPTEAEACAYAQSGRLAEKKTWFYQDFGGTVGWGPTPSGRLVYEYGREGRLIKVTDHTYLLKGDEPDTGLNRVEAPISQTFYLYGRPDARGNWTERAEFDRLLCRGGAEGGLENEIREKVIRVLVYW